jgi:tetratricopeptide (TPR) repeat protein
MLNTVATDSLLLAVYHEDLPPLLDETISRYPDSYNALWLGGSIALDLRDEDRGSRMLSAAAEAADRRHSADGLIRIGGTCLLHGYPNLALGVMKRYQPRYANDPRFLLVMADAYASLELQNEAIQHYYTALELDSTIVDAWVQLGLILDNAGRSPESDAAYRRALAIEPNNVVAANNYAYSLTLHGGNLDTARALSWISVQQQPHNPAYLDTYAWVLFKIGDLDRARIYIEQAIQYGGNATHLEHYGDILEKLGQYRAAMDAWEQSLAKNPDRVYLRSKIDKYR